MQEDKKVHIIGAGISGLIAAIELEKQGFLPTIYEATDRVGGRLKTDMINGYPLDHGFQVLLEAYPLVKKYLNFNSLKLQKLLPGALIYSHNNTMLIGDPLRDFSFFFPTLFAKVGSLSDKFKIFKLNIELKQKSIEDIFNSEQVTTKTYLKSKGFSNHIINTFFKPFFTGIFLETELETSSVMFQFIYKMFGEGLAVIPQNGIEAIPNQLQSHLKHTIFKFNTKVKAVKSGEIILENGEVVSSKLTVIASATNQLIENEPNIPWKSCYNLYFEVEDNPVKKPIIGLVTSKDALINNIYFLDNSAIDANLVKNIVSVTVVKSHNFNELELIKKIQEELKVYCNIKPIKCIKHYHIKKALPSLTTVKQTGKEHDFKVLDGVYQIGDISLNGSLNAAMQSGKLVSSFITNAF